MLKLTASSKCFDFILVLIFLMNNRRIEIHTSRYNLLNASFQQREGEKGFVIKTAKNRRGLYHLMSETVNPSMLRK